MEDDTLLARWLAGELDAKELEVLKNSPKYATLARIKDNFDAIERPQFDGAAMMETILSQEKRVPKVVPLYRKNWFRTAAAAVVVLLGLALFYSLPQKETTANGKTLAFTLPDKSEVILNAGSTSDYHNRSWDSNRSITLDGEAYFEVAKGKTFTVSTGLGTVTVLGTHFNVKARGNRLDVTCYEGRVRVEYNGQETVLTPHRQLIVEDGKMTDAILEVAEDKPVWLGNEISFKKEHFSAVIAELERRYDVAIKSDFKSAKTFTGVLPANDLDGAIRILSELYELKVQKQDKTIVLQPADAKR